MDKQPSRNIGIPTWVWIITGLAIVLGIQFWLSGRFDGPEEIPISLFIEQVKNGQISEFVIRGERLVTQSENGESISATIGSNETLKDLFDLYEVPIERIEQLVIQNNSLKGWNTFLSIAFSILPILLLIWIFTRGFRQLQDGNGSLFSFGRSRAKSLSDSRRVAVTFDDVAGVDVVREDIKLIVDVLRQPEKYMALGARIPRGVLMSGPPGTGKTLLARAIAGEAGVPFFHISGSDFVEMFVGVGASRVRDMFDKAKEQAPAIIFVDEIDAIGRQRGAGLGGGHDEREQTLNQILVEMDGFDTDTTVIVIAATNRPDVLDPALLRPGRFDRRVTLTQPDMKGREEIFKVHLRGKPVASNISLSELALMSPGFVGADIENMINEAAIIAVQENKRVISQAEFTAAIERVVSGLEQKNRLLSVQDKQIIAYHEAGHVVLAKVLPNCPDQVHKVSIISRGSTMGYMFAAPDEDNSITSRSQFKDRLAFKLGGFVAEEIIFNDVTTVASDDLDQVTHLARTMVTSYGMSERLGPIVYKRREAFPFLGKEFIEIDERNYSDLMATKIDDEVQRLINEAYEKAKNILTEYRDKLSSIAQSLIELETLNEEQIARFFD